tara:strand:- start:94 stop:1548 length:1455 start_codon:yes stop_codon:yes gene_type:complete
MTSTYSPLLTDLYQITMAYGYWKTGADRKESVFHLFFRKNPFKGGYTIACGLEEVMDFIDAFQFSEEDLSYLKQLCGNDNGPLFEPAFIDYLRNLDFSCNVDAVEEGTVVFPHQPLLRIQGPIVECQLLETPLLNIINFQSLIATKSARIKCSAGDDPVIEFGLRRAQGPNGALGASRAAYVGGTEATSNVLAAKKYGIPVKGTHAHSWIMSFGSELEAFEKYALAMPNNCLFLVDTYDTIEGIKNAIQVGLQLKKKGHRLVGIRLDSGDLAYLSIEARKLLDGAGFTDALIIASNDLSEEIIDSLKHQGAKINIWGVGTKLVTAYDQPALGGVYKLGAIRDFEGIWEYRIKLSEQIIKVSNPGILQVRRFKNTEGLFIGDMIYNTAQPEDRKRQIVDPSNSIRSKEIESEATFEDLLIPIYKKGSCIYKKPKLIDIKSRVQGQLGQFHESIRRNLNPHEYPVGLESGLDRLKNQLMSQARGML